MKTLNLDKQVACLYGLDAAVLIQNLGYWIERNHANDINRVDGRTWTYNTQEAFARLFPFWTRRTVQRLVGKLVEAGALITAHHGDDSRVTWYALSDDLLLMLDLPECVSDQPEEPVPLPDEPEEPDESAPNGAEKRAPNGAHSCTKRCIDNRNKYNKQKNTPKAPTGGASADADMGQEYPPDFEEFWAEYPRKLDKRRAFRAWRKAALQRCDLPDVLEALRRWKQSDQWQEEKYIPHPTTWLNNRRWESDPPESGKRQRPEEDMPVWN